MSAKVQGDIEKLLALLLISWQSFGMGRKNPLQLRKIVLARVQGDVEKLLALLLICWQSFGMDRLTRCNLEKSAGKGTERHRETVGIASDLLAVIWDGQKKPVAT